MSMRAYTRTETLVANLPYAAMLLLGAWTIAVSLGASPAAVAAAVGYVVYGVAGSIWIMVFVCPCCHYHGSAGCPCGYGLLAAKLVPKGPLECFSRKFKRHIPVIVPLWFIPPICAAIALRGGLSRTLVGLLAAFAVNSFIILPLVSRRHSCHECPQKDDCPWMAREKA